VKVLVTDSLWERLQPLLPPPPQRRRRFPRKKCSVRLDEKYPDHLPGLSNSKLIRRLTGFHSRELFWIDGDGAAYGQRIWLRQIRSFTMSARQCDVCRRELELFLDPALDESHQPCHIPLLRFLLNLRS